MPCTTLDKLIQKHGLTCLDVLQIDAEGHDYEVLKSINLKETQPLLIEFEHGLLSPRAIDDAIHYLSSHGYSVLYGGHQIPDTIALHKDFPVKTDPKMHQLYWSDSVS